MKDAVVVKDVTKRYKGFTLDHVSFRVPQGSIVGFVGENGAGKSTTIRAILDLIRLDGGEVEVLGLNARERQDAAWREKIGAVFDTGHIPDYLTVEQINRVMGAVYRQWERDTFQNFVRRFSLPAKKKYKDFSRGMRMKLSLAVAMSHGAKLLVLDEATSGLDPIVRDEILDLFLEFIQEEDHSILISTHILSDLEKAADYIVFIHQGRVLFEEEKDRLLEDYGIVHCTPEQAERLPQELTAGRRDNRFGTDVLVRDRRKAAAQFPELVLDPASIEDIMLYLAKKEGKIS